ncbi:MAG: hypothetical protein ABIG87_01480 [Patescibacteria group bacterium]
MQVKPQCAEAHWLFFKIWKQGFQILKTLWTASLTVRKGGRLAEPIAQKHKNKYYTKKAVAFFV